MMIQGHVDGALPKENRRRKVSASLNVMCMMETDGEDAIVCQVEMSASLCVPRY